jgi:D-glycero-D-manno-heptose 1,7-bisphosphate phosphatase
MRFIDQRGVDTRLKSNLERMDLQPPGRAVFVDRDGVINEIIYRDGEPGSPRNLAEFQLCEGIREPLRKLRLAGFRLFVVTNQPDLARQLLSDETLAACNDIILQALPFEDIKVCPHDDDDKCRCRKPLPGMLLELTAEAGLALPQSYFIGDTWKDADAALAAGCKSILLDRAYNRGNRTDHRVHDVAQAVELILSGAPR